MRGIGGIRLNRGRWQGNNGIGIYLVRKTYRGRRIWEIGSLQG
jgi:hypothetical protein